MNAVPDVSRTVYEGSYIVTPKTSQQVLKTAFKTMEENLTIKAIPYHVTSNNTGAIRYAR